MGTYHRRLVRRDSTTPWSVVAALAVLSLLMGMLPASPAQAAQSTEVTLLDADDFVHGTYIIDEPGTYRLAEDVSFNPNSPATLTDDVESGAIPPPVAAALGLSAPVDASHAGLPLYPQYAPDGVGSFTPGGPLDARYDPAGYGVGFFAAIAITADDVTLDLNGHTIEQSAEHALLQRFFAVIELADQPFMPAQGPADFGSALDSANNVVIQNGTIGRSAHHGIHGNNNENVTVEDVDFVGYEVAAIALNGARGLTVENVTATNRKDVPVVGTFSSGQFIKQYVDFLVNTGSATTLTVDGVALTPADIDSALRAAINATHHDLIVDPNIVDGRPQIDAAAHADEFALFNNPLGVVDGNSYSFLLNTIGIAVNGFPKVPDGVTKIGSRDILFSNVHVTDQQAFINEVPAISVDGMAIIDPVGAVFQIRNLDFGTGEPVTISDTDDTVARYTGNAVANAQALVAKAALDGEFAGSPLDVTRINMPEHVLEWVEGTAGYATIADAGISYVCNGDSMFHVNKGVIGFKMDAASSVRMDNTSVTGLHNFGDQGSTLCGDYRTALSHPLATLQGYGGAASRAYTFSGTTTAVVSNSSVSDVSSRYGVAVGFDVLTDSDNVKVVRTTVDGLDAGWGGSMTAGGPTAEPYAIGYHIGSESTHTEISRSCATNLTSVPGAMHMLDESGTTAVRTVCRN